MKRAERAQGAGYTILETMIFLAVSAAMFVTAMAFISGRQNRTEFAAAVRDFQSSINDIANDVSNGYYANTSSNGNHFYCSINVATREIAIKNNKPDDDQGSNQGCIFIGKALQFRPSPDGDDRYIDITLAGRQYKDGVFSLGDAQSYADSGVKAVAQSSKAGDSTPDAHGVSRLGGGVTVACVLYIDDTVPNGYTCGDTRGMTKVDTVAFMTTFQAANLSDAETKTGSVAVNMVVPLGLTRSDGHRTLKAVVDDLNHYDVTGNTLSNPKGGVFICLQSNGTDQHAWVKIGGQMSRFTTDANIVVGGC